MKLEAEQNNNNNMYWTDNIKYIAYFNFKRNQLNFLQRTNYLEI